jgi:hypothetical protein
LLRGNRKAREQRKDQDKHAAETYTHIHFHPLTKVF